jgi:hypothetical protein
MASQTDRKPAIKRAGTKPPAVAVKPLTVSSKKLAPIVKVTTTKAVQVKPKPKLSESKASVKPKTKTADKAVASKAKKAKLVRDSFTIPKDEYMALQKLKDRSTMLTKPAKKGELLRAGLLALAKMPDAAFLAILAAIPALKTGRPKGKKTAKN